MKRFYDSENKRLIYIGTAPDPAYWDGHWSRSAVKDIFAYPPKLRFMRYHIKKYLAKGDRILEGGCGLGDKLYALEQDGFESYGVDFAPETLKKVKTNWPHLNVSFADVRELPYGDSRFHGYCSFGVIEHFYNGYSPILFEIKRVLKPGGFVFLTFPAFSGCRRSRATHKKYEPYRPDYLELNKFYQFALDPDKVQLDFEKLGFEVILKNGQGSLKGLKEEFPRITPIIHRILRLPGKIGTVIGLIVDIFFGKYFGHSYFLILKNRLSDLD